MQRRRWQSCEATRLKKNSTSLARSQILDSRRQSFHSSRKDLRKLLEHFLVEQSVGGQQLAAVDRKRCVAEVGDLAAGLFHEQDGGGRVPGIQVELQKCVEGPAGDITKVQGSGTGSAHAVRAQGDLVIEVDVRVFVAFVAGKSRGHQAFRQPRRLGNVDGQSVQPRATSLFSGEHLVATRGVDHAGNTLPFVFESQGNAEHTVALGKVRCSIKGIDVPAQVAALLVPAAFFANQVMTRPLFANARYYELF